ncbi:hypothetical protein [Niallia sp.]|nr:hypothetical protein [Niallia sp.]
MRKKQGKEGKVVFINRMNAKKQEKKGKSGFHKVDERQKGWRKREKWFS